MRCHNAWRRFLATRPVRASATHRPVHELRTDTEIAAQPEQIWAALTDFAAYPRWNPFIRYVRGVAEEGRSLEVVVRGRGSVRTAFRARVLVADRPHELRWRGHLCVPGALTSEHRFLIEPLPDGGSRFQQNGRFSGLLTPIFRSTIDREIQRGLREMNAALKGLVERGSENLRVAPRERARD